MLLVVLYYSAAAYRIANVVDLGILMSAETWDRLTLHT